MKLPEFMKQVTLNDGKAPQAPEYVLYIPPGGAPVECPSMETATAAAQAFAGRNPGKTVAVYQLAGYAFMPVRPPEFTTKSPDQNLIGAGPVIDPNPAPSPVAHGNQSEHVEAGKTE